MANTITEVVPKLLAQGLLALRENAILPRIVNRSYDTLAAQRGNVINIPIPSAISARAVTPAVAMASNLDFTPTVAVVTLDQWYEAPFQLSDNDMVSVMENVIPMQASEAIKSLANNIDAYILGKHTSFYGLAGTAGTEPFNGSLNIAASARMLLNRQLAPLSDRRAVIDPMADSNLLINTEVLKVNERGDRDGLIEGTIGRKLGFDWFMDQNVPTYTPGTGWASGNIASTVAGAVGDTTLNIINATASGQIKVGDIFYLTADADKNQYVITTTGTISATVAALISFYPPLKTTAATGATLVVVSLPYAANLAFHRDAIAFASRPLADMNGYGNMIASQVDPVSGLALRLEVSRQYKQTTFSFDVLYGSAVVRRELGAKIAGGS